MNANIRWSALGSSLLALAALCALQPLSAAAEHATKPAATEPQPPIADQLANETAARRDADRRTAIAEAKAELTSAAVSRLEVWIGVYGIIIGFFTIIGGLLTRNQALKAKEKAQLAASVAGVEATKAAKLEMFGFQNKADDILRRLTEKHNEAALLTDNLREQVEARPGTELVQHSQLAQVDQLETAAKQIEAKTKSDWTAADYRILLFAAAEKRDWERYIKLAEHMAWNHDKSPEDLAFGLFAIAFGYAESGKPESAAMAYERYLFRCPDDAEDARSVAFGNWGKALGQTALSKESSEKTEAERLWALANEKFASALDINPENHKALNNWSATLMYQLRGKSSRSKASLLKQAEKHLLSAEKIRPGSGSYNLACIAGLRGNAADAAKWLRFAQATATKIPDCIAIAAERDFDAVEKTPEFQQALIDIGCAPAAKG